MARLFLARRKHETTIPAPYVCLIPLRDKGVVMKLESVNMKTYFRKFINSEDGAITVDWVVLTAAIVGLGFIIIIAVRPAVFDKTDDIAAVITTDVSK
jgi:Flp pilus assembly pilin Flp